MAKSVLIVDDEALARERLCRLLEKHGAFTDIRVAVDGAAAVTEICSHSPDVVFLDVQMPFMSGFDVIEKIGVTGMPRVVFVTAYDQYAVRAFDVNAVDYLLKPYTEQRFTEALGKVLATDLREQNVAVQKTLDNLAQAGRAYVQRLVVRQKDELVVLKVSDVEWIEAANNYVKICYGKSVYVLREAISALEAQLDPRHFARIHRSTIVNIDRIRAMRPWFSGDYIVVMESGKQLRLSRTHRHKLNMNMTGGSS